MPSHFSLQYLITFEVGTEILPFQLYSEFCGKKSNELQHS